MWCTGAICAIPPRPAPHNHPAPNSRPIPHNRPAPHKCPALHTHITSLYAKIYKSGDYCPALAPHTLSTGSHVSNHALGLMLSGCSLFPPLCGFFYVVCSWLPLAFFAFSLFSMSYHPFTLHCLRVFCTGFSKSDPLWKSPNKTPTGSEAVGSSSAAAVVEEGSLMPCSFLRSWLTVSLFSPATSSGSSALNK